MMFCRNCGKEVDVQDKFCSACGQRIGAAQGGEFIRGTINIVDDTEGQARFRVKCEYCYCVFEYGMGDLGYRVWYPHGFVYCPKCNRPLRHKLEYRV